MRGRCQPATSCRARLDGQSVHALCIDTDVVPGTSRLAALRARRARPLNGGTTGAVPVIDLTSGQRGWQHRRVFAADERRANFELVFNLVRQTLLNGSLVWFTSVALRERPK